MDELRADDRLLSKADQTASDADQGWADTDQTLSDSDQAYADEDQRAADDDQAMADGAHSASSNLSTDEADRSSRPDRSPSATPGGLATAHFDSSCRRRWHEEAGCGDRRRC